MTLPFKLSSIVTPRSLKSSKCNIRGQDVDCAQVDVHHHILSVGDGDIFGSGPETLVRQH